MPSLQQLKYLVAVDQFRNFSRAAEACHVSQPSLSQQIKEAEEELGIAIFERNKRQVQPTPRGQILLQQARVVLQESEKLKYLSQQEKNEIRGEFHLAVIPTVAPYLIPLFLKSFAESYPKVALHIVVLKTDDIIQELRSDRIDAGLLATPLEESAIFERPLFVEPLFVFSHPDNYLSKKTKVTEEDLRSGQIWLLGEGHCFRQQMLSICGVRGKHRVFKNVDFASGDFETLVQLVLKNGGSTLLPYLAAETLREREVGKFLRPFARPVPTRQISIVHSKSAMKIEIIEALEKTIMENLPAELLQS